ncbi:ATP-binding protein [Herminiimonas sp. KBW02]|uniref:ATP-binding protein n=1 Tax=Herminiimonas sp. KBW02 TaxID=2153363 RepID=UPI0013153D7D|nr:ATP-binding protein [Herminiimonas sp. KBW02]
MNAAAYSAQIYFDQREELLRSLRNSAIRQSASLSAPHSYKDVRRSGLTAIPLPAESPANSWTLFLTERDLDAISSAHTRLIHFLPKQRKKATSIWPVESVSAIVSPRQAEVIARELTKVEHASDEQLSQKMIWLDVSGKMRDSLYIFSLLDPSQPAAGWLGLELHSIDTGIDFSSIHGSSYVLLDQNENTVLQSVPESEMPGRLRQNFKEDAFGLYGNDFWPDYMALNKRVGEAGWNLVYYIPIGHLLYDGRLAIQLALGLCALLIAAVFFGMRHIRDRLIIPAIKQYDALLDMASFSQTMIETAPVALCVLRRANGSVALANELTRSWFAGEGAWQARVLTNPYTDKDREMTLRGGRKVYLTIAPTRYRGEEVLLCAFIDITAHKRIETSLLQAKITADEANTAKTVFLTTMSHELRTPLYGMLGALELFSLTAVTNQQRMYLQAMQQSSSILLNVVSDTLDISSIEAGQVKLDMAPFSPLALIEEVVATYAARAERKALDIYSLPDPRIPDALTGDVIRIKQILNNLMNNAIKFTETGQVVVRSELLSATKEMVTLSVHVEDTGQGIEPTDLVHIFEPFYQVERDALLKNGTGLGLSICRRFAQMMDGTMNATSEPGAGSIFSLTISLPVNKDAVTQDNPVLSGVKVYAHSEYGSLSQNICDWLALWGASAHCYDQKQQQDDGQSILLDIVSLKKLMDAAWKGPRIVARLSASSLDDETKSKSLQVQSYSVRSIAKAIGRAQRYHDAAEPVKIKARTTALNLSILTVEDNPINRMILKEQLTYLGCKVEFSGNGREALDRPDVMEFDIILTDVNMPLVDGYELTARLRKQGYQKPIFGITANAIPEDEQRCRAAGMNMVLTKPLSIAALEDGLQSIH